jgi:hypothetical protein
MARPRAPDPPVGLNGRLMKRALAALSGIGLILVACGGDDTVTSTLPRVSETVPLGELPEPPTATGPQVTPPTIAPPTTVPEPEVVPITAPVGDVVSGNRVLLIGDTAMMSLTPRHDGIACDVLGDVGWQVGIEAELGRYVGFAEQVIDTLVVDAGDDWDVVGLMFGHHLDTTPDEFGEALDTQLDVLGDVPVLLYTRSEVDDDSAALNEIIRDRADARPNVLIVDWGQAVADEEDLTLVDDNGLPTAEGMERIVLLTAAALGEPPTDADGECLDPLFTDDSAIIV